MSIFETLAEPNRRSILDLLLEADQPVGAIVDSLDIGQPTVSKHLKVLRTAGLVTMTIDGNKRIYGLRPDPLTEVDGWLLPYRQLWAGRLDALERFLDTTRPPSTRRRHVNINDRLGEVLRKDDLFGLRYERRLAHPPERVWRAITESDQLRHWMPTDIVGDRREGASIQLPFWTDVVEKYHIEETTSDGRILTWDPPNTFSFMWDRDTLIFELRPEGAGTLLVFTTWVVDTTAGVHRTAAGYHVCLDQLVALIETGDPPPFIDQDPTPYEETYGALIGVE